MATQTKTVEVLGVSGQTTAFAAKRNSDATGTASSVTVSEVTGTGIYTVSVNWNDASASNEPLGDWAISVGNAAGYLGRSVVTFAAGEDDYTIGADPSSLNGEYALSVTVVDDSDSSPIESANVRIYRSGREGTQSTDSAGETVFGLDAATWSYVVSAAGYQSVTGIKVVASDDSLAIELTPVVQVPIGTGNSCRCTLGVVAIDESPITGATLSASTKDKNAFVGNSLVFPEQNKPTSVDGIIVVYLVRGLEYDIAVQYNRKEVRFSFTCPNASSANMGEVAV